MKAILTIVAMLGVAGAASAQDDCDLGSYRMREHFEQAYGCVWAWPYGTYASCEDAQADGQTWFLNAVDKGSPGDGTTHHWRIDGYACETDTNNCSETSLWFTADCSCVSDVECLVKEF